MNKLLSVILAALMIFSAFSSLSFAGNTGTTYYVDSVLGNDSNNGTSEESAFRSLAKASSLTYGAGDKILLKCGEVFEGTFWARGSGTKDNPVVVSYYGDIAFGKPILKNCTDASSLVVLTNVSGWTFDGLSLTENEGRGFLIRATDGVNMENLTINNCDFKDFHYVTGGISGPNFAPMLICSDKGTARINHLTVSGCNFCHCGYGIIMDGISQEWSADIYESPEKSYNHNFLIENITMDDILYDGIIIMSVQNIVVRNSSFINVSMDTTSATAPVWSHHADNFLFENCEVGGSANYHDGMAIDFDGWTTNSTAQYIYSHDNQRFINNCCYDGWTRNDNCTVRYCLSVNDNKCKNSMAQIFYSTSHEYEEGEMSDYMDNFKFYNNTIINMGEMEIKNLRNSVIANNIFVGEDMSYFYYTRKNTDDETEEWVVTEFDGLFSNNCFCGVSVPYLSKKNYICEPGFIGNDLTDINSFKLSKSSCLIGKGIEADDDMGETDFYGNLLTENHNIGCYDGEGENIKISISIKDIFKHIYWGFISTIYNLSDTISGRFWLF